MQITTAILFQKRFSEVRSGSLGSLLNLCGQIHFWTAPKQTEVLIPCKEI